MKNEVIVIIAEDDEGHASLIKKNLKRAGINNQIIHFIDGQQVLDFLFRSGDGPHRDTGSYYLLLLDIRMPKVDGMTVLEKIKRNDELKKIPVIMLTTTDDPRDINRCHKLGCSNYIVKPVDYEKFVDTVKQLGLFFTITEVPQINGD